VVVTAVGVAVPHLLVLAQAQAWLRPCLSQSPNPMNLRLLSVLTLTLAQRLRMRAAAAIQLIHSARILALPASL
jgi:hypothetical protein